MYLKSRNKKQKDFKLAFNINNMAVKKLKKRKVKRVSGLGGWLLIVLMLFILSWISAAKLLYERVVLLIENGSVSYGVHISMFFLAVYCIFLGYSIYLALKKKRIAVKTSIISLAVGIIFLLWYYVVGRIIFYSSQQNLIASGFVFFLTNLILAVLISVYLKSSKRVKNTFVK